MLNQKHVGDSSGIFFLCASNGIDFIAISVERMGVSEKPPDIRNLVKHVFWWYSKGQPFTV